MLMVCILLSVIFFHCKADTVVEAHAAVGENVNKDKDSDEFGDKGDLSRSLEFVASDLLQVMKSTHRLTHGMTLTMSTFQLLSTKSDKLQDSSKVATEK